MAFNKFPGLSAATIPLVRLLLGNVPTRLVITLVLRLTVTITVTTFTPSYLFVI
jgi:hypothetical protein